MGVRGRWKWGPSSSSSIGKAITWALQAQRERDLESDPLLKVTRAVNGRATIQMVDVTPEHEKASGRQRLRGGMIVFPFDA